MDKILLYKYCEQALEMLIRNHQLSPDDCESISEEYASTIYEEMKTTGVGVDAAGFGELKVRSRIAKEKKDSRYYENLIDELEKKKHGEELRERELAINESVADASLRSAKAAEQSANYAKEANRISLDSNSIAKTSNRRAVIAIVISAISTITSVVSCNIMMNNNKKNNSRDNTVNDAEITTTISTSRTKDSTKTYKSNIKAGTPNYKKSNN